MLVEQGRRPIRDDIIHQNGASHTHPDNNGKSGLPITVENPEDELKRKVADITAGIYSTFQRKLVDTRLMEKVKEEHAGLPAQVLVYILQKHKGLSHFDIMEQVGVVNTTYMRWINFYLDPALTGKVDAAWQDEAKKEVLEKAVSKPPRPDHERWPFYYQYHKSKPAEPVKIKVLEMYEDMGEFLGANPLEQLAQLKAKYSIRDLSLKLRKPPIVIGNWMVELEKFRRP